MQTLAASGYGLWAQIGVVLTLDLRLDGRGEVLVPLGLGMAMVALGWLAGAPAHDKLRPMLRPDRASLMALVTLLPMLAVAGLARGSNEFWATRLFAAVLAACALLMLLLGFRQPSAEHSEPPRPGAVLGALFSGGQWLWLGLALQGPSRPDGNVDLSLLGLLLLGMAFGLLSLDPPSGPALLRRGPACQLAAGLMFIVPCALLAAASTLDYRAPLALCSALSCQLGLALRAVLVDDDAASPTPLT